MHTYTPLSLLSLWQHNKGGHLQPNCGPQKNTIKNNIVHELKYMQIDMVKITIFTCRFFYVLTALCAFTVC